MNRKHWRALVIAGVALLTTACSPQRSVGVNISGSTSVSPFVEHLGEMYRDEHAGAHIDVQSLGSSAGIQAAIKGVADIGMSSRELKPEEAETLDELVIARDALAVIVHPQNPVRNLTLAEVRAIFAGKIKRWSEVGGVDAPITLVAREAGSGTYSAFEELVLGKDVRVTDGALRQGSNGAIRQVVAEDANAIGYISLGIVDASVHAIAVDGVEATHDAVLAGRYTFVRRFLFVWPKGTTLDAEAQAFVDYVMSDGGQAELERLGLVKAKQTQP
jgi:phosphate transport system substrate-binding protein